jgi:hypothetical protein
MKAAFTEGRAVRFNVPNGIAANVVRYDGEGFYVVDSAVDALVFTSHPDGGVGLVAAGTERRRMIAHEDDLVLDEDRFVVLRNGTWFLEGAAPCQLTGEPRLQWVTEAGRAKEFMTPREARDVVRGMRGCLVYVSGGDLTKKEPCR